MRIIASTVITILVLGLLPKVSADPIDCLPLPAGLTSWWPAEGNAEDQAKTNSGGLVGGVTFAAGKVGQAFNLNGIDALVLIPDAPNLRFSVAMTVEAWVYPRVRGGHYREIVSKWEGAGNNQRSYTLTVMPSGVLAWTVCSDGGNVNLGPVFGSTLIPTNQWSHVAGVFDGGALKLYLNGVLEGSAPWTLGIFPGVAPLTVGSTLSSGSFFDGLIDEASLYNRALTPLEIQGIYAAGTGGKCGTPPHITGQPQSQVGYWGKSVTFASQVTGSPPMSYLWSKEGFPISWATNSSLTLTDIQLGDGGGYTLTATNLYGTATSQSAFLTVNPSGVSLGLYPGITIDGVVGKTYGIQYVTNVTAVNTWTSLTNLTLTQPVQIWFDAGANLGSGDHPQRFYRVVPVP
jgi:hypothetical protein